MTLTMKLVCEHIGKTRAMQWTQGYAYETLARETGCSEDEAFEMMELAEQEGYMECGVSIRTGWLTPKGDALVNS